MGKRKGFLTPKTYFPKKNDVLINEEEGSNWTCVRNNEYVDDKTGEKIRYALVIGRHPDLGDTPIPQIWHDRMNIERELGEYSSVLRPKGRSGDMVEYVRNENGVFEEA